MNAAELFESVEMALAVTGLPQFDSVDFPGQQEFLKFVPALEGDAPTWALCSQSEEEEYVGLDVVLAEQVLRSYFRDWLLVRGWQVQVHCYTHLRRWSLVDCLSATDGGGDRLDVDYPYGEDELTVLCQSVLAVNTLE